MHTPATPSSSTNTQTAAIGAPSRVTFEREEVMRVLDLYPIGTIKSVREMIAGSSDAPKAVIEADRGKMLLKRRARGLEHAGLVGFAHEVILGCLEQGVCVPPLIGTTDDNNSMCQIADKTYELFVFIEGTAFDQSVGHASQSGALLGELHHAMDSINTRFEAATESVVVNPQRALQFQLPEQTLKAVTRILEYGLDAHRANARESAIVHGDWHPGNMIFDGPEIVAICDFDNCRLGSRDRELAQALIYLSMKRPSKDGLVPADPSMEHLLAVWKGYKDQFCTDPDPRLIASLMPAVLLDEALAGEPVVGSALFEAMLAKAQWLDEHIPEIARLFESA